MLIQSGRQSVSFLRHRKAHPASQQTEGEVCERETSRIPLPRWPPGHKTTTDL